MLLLQCVEQDAQHGGHPNYPWRRRARALLAVATAAALHESHPHSLCEESTSRAQKGVRNQSQVSFPRPSPSQSPKSMAGNYPLACQWRGDFCHSQSLLLPLVRRHALPILLFVSPGRLASRFFTYMYQPSIPAILPTVQSGQARWITRGRQVLGPMHVDICFCKSFYSRCFFES